MFGATRYTAENDAVDWHAVADQLFPVEALQTTAPVFNPLAVVRSGN
jgi:hypothetical protein